MATNYIAMDDNIANASIVLLQRNMNMAVDIYLQLKQAHWNVKGPNFVSLHELFDKLHEEMGEHVDELAERIVTLGGVADGTVQNVAEKTELAAYPTDIRDGNAHLTAVAQSLSQFAKSVRAAIAEAGEAGDEGTVDVFNGISTAVDKSIWFVEAHFG